MIYLGRNFAFHVSVWRMWWWGIRCRCSSSRVYQHWKRFPLLIQGEEGSFLLVGKNSMRLHSTLETVMKRAELPARVNQCYIPVLKLPVSGYVMKGVFVVVMEMKDLQDGNDFLMNSEDDGSEDKEEAAYTEAVKEILEKHRGMMHTIDLVWIRCISEPEYCF